jgi:hypothetical protein
MRRIALPQRETSVARQTAAVSFDNQPSATPFLFNTMGSNGRHSWSWHSSVIQPGVPENNQAPVRACRRWFLPNYNKSFVAIQTLIPQLNTRTTYFPRLIGADFQDTYLPRQPVLFTFSAHDLLRPHTVPPCVLALHGFWREVGRKSPMRRIALPQRETSVARQTAAVSFDNQPSATSPREVRLRGEA